VSALATQLHRISAISRRDARTMLTYQFQLLLQVGNILISVILFYFIGELVTDSPAMDDIPGGYFEFVLIGLIVTGFAAKCLGALSENLQRAQNDDTLEILLATSTPLGVLMFGSLAVPLALATFDGLVYLVFGMAFASPAFQPGGILPALVVLVLLLGTFAAIGILGASIIIIAKRGDPISMLALQLSTVLAGVYFPVSVLPDALQVVARLIPTFYGLRGIRAALLDGAGWAGIAFDAGVLVLFNLVLIPASLWVLGRAIRRAKVAGTLGNR
jgi:ABC-2 type transport system permease protein